jgi:hypothetical protein
VAAEHSPSTVDAVGAERIGVVAHHLFLAKAVHGVFIPMDEADEKSILRAYRDLLKQKAPEESETEGVMKELQAL